MTMFHFEVQMTEPSDRHWTVGLKLEAKSYTEALQLFKAWSHGVQSVSDLTPYLCNLSGRPTLGRGYLYMNSPKAILKELTSFMHRDGQGPEDNNDCSF